MSILVDKNTRVIVQGITGQAGAFHTEKMLEYKTQVVGGVTPGKGGSSVHGVPVFNTVQEAVSATGANATIVFVPAKFAFGAVSEALEAKLPLIVIITEGIPTLDMLRLKRRVAPPQGSGRAGLPAGQAGAPVRIIGPNCPGLITPGQCKLGIMPGYIHRPGSVAVLSRSGTLTYDAVYQLTQAGLGQSTCVGIGGDPVIGSSFTDLLGLLQPDAQTEAIVLIGEIGGTEEEEAAAYIKAQVTKPVFAFVAGRMAPKEKRMGHAGAIIAGGHGTAAEKLAALQAAGVTIVESPAEIGKTVKAALARRPSQGLPSAR
ncbi:MAG: succinate--CoA ligase subunit alpha [Candidatus Omnitrophica bacterium]|nr:succinate--CoA ligase subunit alpha [Candidatus Omnitrophota bacterium]